MTQAAADEPADRAPALVLRRTADYDGSGRRLRWELADPWAEPGQPPAASAATDRDHEVVQLSRVDVAADAPAGSTRCLVQQLVAALRRTDAGLVSCSLPDQELRAELVAAGFVALPEEPIDTGRPPVVRLILQL